ncbi:MAG: hypothetical protein JWO77_1554 [Ilumatobacteraceae bacterium]|nr:hypothetical protein [Ilumatobacteraceae bacterium]
MSADHLRLGVIGDTQHYRDSEGRLCALEPVVLQLDRWAALFDELVLCAPLAPGPPPAGYAPYRAANVRIVPVPSGGGNTLREKLSMIKLLPVWARTTRRVARDVDGVHLRCPSNIGFVGILSTWKATSRRHGFYAGVWRAYDGEPFFFGLQRRLLGSRWFDGPVSVYATRDPHRPNLEPFFSPSFTEAYWEEAGPAADTKIERLGQADRSGPWRFVTVGRLTPNKNQRTVVEAMAKVVAAGVDGHLDVYGDGPSRPELEQLAASLGIAERVAFHGSVDFGEVMAAFQVADLHLLATRQEGFGKVLLEGMVHATVPVFSESPLADEISGSGSRGLVFATDDADGLAAHVTALVADGTRWQAMAADARTYTASMTLDRFADRVRETLERGWGVTLPDPPATDR